MIGLFCGFNRRPAATGYLIHKPGFEQEEVAHVGYGGGNRPGGFLVEGRDGGEALIPENWHDYVNLVYVTRRCLTCRDLTNELADISVGDMRLEEYTGGWSTVIGRSPGGDDILKEAALKGVIRIDEISPDHTMRPHAHLFAHKNKGYFVRQRWLRVPLNYSLQRPSIGMVRWLQHIIAPGTGPQPGEWFHTGGCCSECPLPG